MADGSSYTPGLVPGANPSGSSNSGGGMPAPFGGTTSSLGGAQNPMLPSFPSGQSVPPPSSTMSPTMAAPTGAATPNGQPGTSSLATGLGINGVNGSWAPNQNDFVKAMHKAGFSAGDAALLYNFLASGAGFSQDQLNNLFQSMQPQIQQGEADIMEQFSGHGLRDSSSAQIGIGDYLGQIHANELQAEFGAYEQSVQNYMTVLMAGKGPAPQNTFQNIMQYMNTAANASKAAATAAAA